jgi:hypothetical protein
MDEENVLDFLTSLEAMDLPDRIEEVNARILSKIVEDTDYVAVLFCKCNQTSANFYLRVTKIDIVQTYVHQNLSYLLYFKYYMFTLDKICAFPVPLW